MLPGRRTPRQNRSQVTQKEGERGGEESGKIKRKRESRTGTPEPRCWLLRCALSHSGDLAKLECVRPLALCVIEKRREKKKQNRNKIAKAKAERREKKYYKRALRWGMEAI